MTTEARLIYSSSNGDRWLLVPQEGSGWPRVRHEPNRSSGGLAAEIEIADFLLRDGRGPQHDALRVLLGTSLFPGGKDERGLRTAAPDAPEAGRITAAQIRAGRGLLGWSEDRLAQEAQLERDELADCESGRGTPPYDHLVRIGRTLGLAGVVLIGEGEITAGGPGVRMGALGTSTGYPGEAPESDLNDNDRSDEAARANAAR